MNARAETVFAIPERSCPRCARRLERFRGGDGVEFYISCTNSVCRERNMRRITRVGCWGTTWRHPEEIAAVKRTHDRVCTGVFCKAARR